MVALAVILIAAAGMLSVIISSSTMDRMTRDFNQASSAAKRELERLQTINYNDEIRTKLVSGKLEGNFDVEGLSPSPKDSLGDSQRVGYFIVQEVNSGDGNLVDIRAVVEWKGPSGRHERVEITSRRSDRGENWKAP